MRCYLTFLIGLFAQASLFAQTVEETYPKTIWCENDTFLLKYHEFPGLDTFTVSRKDRQSPGMDASPGVYAVLYYNNDSLRLNYHNRLPYQHNFYVNFESPKGKTTLRYHFNELTCYFSPDYIEEKTGKISFEIPETYELANIIWALSPAGTRATDLYKEGGYYKRVLKHFKTFLGHPVFKALNIPDSLAAETYYNFRENSFAFNFDSQNPATTATSLHFNGPYYYVYGNQLADSSLFGKLKPLVEDFAKRSSFRKFYADNREYYQKQSARLEQLLPVRQMWNWLEEEFPKIKYHTYKIVFSPLIGGSHSTQNYWTYAGSAWYRQAVMFVCGPARYDSLQTLNEKKKEGLMSGVVFTEIDHNYVNPASNRFVRSIDSIFSNRKAWTIPGKSSNFYASPVSIFNEYMTHAVFCLYVREKYDSYDAAYIINAREDLMVNKRNFYRFRDFNRELEKLREKHRNVKISELYPYIIDWCRDQN